jgi:hypothetical protein
VLGTLKYLGCRESPISLARTLLKHLLRGSLGTLAHPHSCCYLVSCLPNTTLSSQRDLLPAVKSSYSALSAKLLLQAAFYLLLPSFYTPYESCLRKPRTCSRKRDLTECIWRTLNAFY